MGQTNSNARWVLSHRAFLITYLMCIAIMSVGLHRYDHLVIFVRHSRV
jgi:hypothetical protein